MKEPTPELRKQLQVRRQLRLFLAKPRNEKLVGGDRLHAERKREYNQRQLRTCESLVNSMLADEGFPPDYDLGEDDDSQGNAAKVGPKGTPPRGSAEAKVPADAESDEPAAAGTKAGA